jgi:hypothetical protein
MKGVEVQNDKLGVAGFHIAKDVVDLAHKKGFFVLKRKGEAFTASTADMKAF